MQPAFSTPFPEPLPVAMPQLSEKPRHGVRSWNPALHPGQFVCNSRTAIGLQIGCSGIVSGTVVAPSNAPVVATPSTGVCTGAGAVAGASAGALIGEGVGALVGGGVGTLVAPGVGTIGGGALGGSGGATVGAAIGGLLGGIVGNVLCSSGGGSTQHGGERLGQRNISQSDVDTAVKTAEETGQVTTRIGKYGTPQNVYNGTNGLTVVIETAGRNAGKIITAWWR